MTTKHLRYANTVALILALSFLLTGVFFESITLIASSIAFAVIGGALSLYVIEVYVSILLEAIMNQVAIDQNPMFYVDQDHDSHEDIR